MSVVMLSTENRQLFGEQVNDHVAKLNDLMGLACGKPMDRTPVEKACFAGRLLEGSTRMLGLDEWCGTLTMFRDLLERSLSAGRHWDEQVSQIVCEILEAEELAVAEIVASEDGEIESINFSGLKQEIELVLSEPFEAEGKIPSEPGVSIERETSSEEGPQFEMPSFNSATVETAEQADIPEQGESISSHAEGFVTIARLQESLRKIDYRLEECLSEGNRGDEAVRDLELAIGESEFFMAMLGSMLSRLGENRKSFRSKVSSSTVMDGLKDFVGVHSRLRNWKTELRTRTDDFSLEREAAADLAVILENCVFDICRMSERSNRRDVSLKIDVSSEGSYMTARVFDDAGDYLSDSEIDRDDAMAYYHGLLQARGLLRKWGALLWVEPGDGSEDRFRFTFPRTSVITDYHLIDSTGTTVAVPKHGVDSVIDLSRIQTENDQGGRFVRFGRSRIPLCRIDEIATDELGMESEGDHAVIIGHAEKRIGILTDGPGKKVEGLLEQVTENSWASVSRRLLHIGEREFPILDVQMVLDRYGRVQGLDEEIGETGSWVDEVVETS
jgi:chemotaxis protein histidine kinase CheA